MSGQLGSLVVSLEANIAEFNRNMNEASQRTENAMARIGGAVETVKSSLIFMGAAVIATGLTVMVRETLDAADSLRDMSQMTGIAVEQLNGLAFAASQAGGSLDSVVAAAGKLNKSIIEASGGNKDAGAAFKALGIDVRDASGQLKTADVVMAEVADQFQKYSDGPEKAALATQLFGKAGAAMIPLLNEGGEAMRENSAYAQQYSHMTTALSDGADNFNDTMGKLTVQQKSFGTAMTAAVLPVLQAVADELLGAAEGSNKFALAGEIARTVLETFVIVGSEVAFVFKAVGNEIGGIAAQVAALASGDTKAFTFIGDAMKRDAAVARKEHDAFIARVLDRTPAKVAVVESVIKPPAPTVPGGGVTKGAKTVSKGKDEAELDAAARAAERMIILANDETVAVRGTIEATEELIAADVRRAKESERITADADGIRMSLMSEVEAEQFSYDVRIQQLQAFSALRLENVEQANAAIIAETARHEQAKAEIQAAYNLQSLGAMGSTADQLYSLLSQSADKQSGLAKAAFLVSKAIAVAEIIMQTNVAAAKAKGQLGIFGMPMSAVILATGYSQAAMVAGLAIAGAREKGGPVWSGGTFLVGEKGPELFTPSTGGTIIPNDALKGGGGGVTINNSPVINIDSRTDQQEVRKIVSMGVAQGNADLVDKLTRAGRI